MKKHWAIWFWNVLLFSTLPIVYCGRERWCSGKVFENSRVNQNNTYFPWFDLLPGPILCIIAFYRFCIIVIKRCLPGGIPDDIPLTNMDCCMSYCVFSCFKSDHMGDQWSPSGVFHVCACFEEHVEWREEVFGGSELGQILGWRGLGEALSESLTWVQRSDGSIGQEG